MSAMIGGIAANNASGMCCGTCTKLISHSMPECVSSWPTEQFLIPQMNRVRAHSGQHTPAFWKKFQSLPHQQKENLKLAERIRSKYKMKNTTGYSINALIDFTDPFDIIEHLMIGSEGTLGFISEINLKTVTEHRFRASSLLMIFGKH